jgi:hypothetical protein
MQQYFGFGLKIESELEFPELLQSTFAQADVTIAVDDLSRQEASCIESKDDEFFFVVKGVARYFASQGNHMIIDPENKSVDPRSIRLYALATVMAAILLQRQMLPFHASAVSVNNKLILISGESGTGKSTTLTGLILRGYKVFSDDVVVLNRTGPDRVSAFASYPMIKLWRDSMTIIDHPQFSDCSFPIRHDLDKYGFFFHDTFVTQARPVSTLIILKKGEQPECSMRRLHGTEAFTDTYRQLYRLSLIRGKEQNAVCFRTISALAKAVNIFEITRPATCHPEQLISFVEQELLQPVACPV